MLSDQAEAEMTYQRHLASLQGWVGWFALVRGANLGGVFPSYEAAAAAWMSLYGPVPALIRRIERTTDGVPAEEPVRGANPARYIETITPAEADARLAISCNWVTNDGRRKGNADFAA